MNLITGKMVLGATLALSLSTFAFPVGAANVTREGSIQIAQAEHPDLEDKAASKTDEVKGEIKGATAAVKRAHRRHERREHLHHTIGSKLDAKVGEVKEATTGAADAVETKHEQHESMEH